jgi:hypothetical protein
VRKRRKREGEGEGEGEEGGEDNSIIVVVMH